MRPDEESRSGGLADFKWSSLRIGSGNGNRSDAKGIIVGSHDRQRERRLIKALKLTGRRRFAPASRRFLFQELTKARRSRPALPALRWRCWFARAARFGAALGSRNGIFLARFIKLVTDVGDMLVRPVAAQTLRRQSLAEGV